MKTSTTYPANQITVIDAYYKGANGWTYSHTLLDDKEVSLDINETYEDLYLTRVLEDNPNPQYNLLNQSIHDTVIAKSANGDLLEYKNKETV
tara:strand:- start:614 stop:889 length:276 start_codon:yes stop_codon:yes gene_type:complete